MARTLLIAAAIACLVCARPAVAQNHQAIQVLTMPQIRAIEAAKPEPGSPEAKFGGGVRAIVERSAHDPAKARTAVSLDVDTARGADLSATLKALHGTIDAENSDAATGRFRITLPASAIRDLAKDASVERLHLLQRGRGNAGSPYAADGLVRLGFDDPVFRARRLTGRNIRVGVISDSVDYHLEKKDALAHHAIDASTTILSDSLDPASNDEGLAMLEVIHAAASDTKLFFAAGMDSTIQFRKAVASLLDAHCDIIVDDVVFPEESPFENDEIAKTVNAAAAKGVIFISAAGNLGNKRLGTSGTWEHDYQFGTAAGQLYGKYASGDLVLFEGTDTFDTIDKVLPGHVPTVDLFWAEPLGAPKAKYDLFLIAGDNHKGTKQWRVAGYALSADARMPHLSIPVAHKGDSVVILKVSGSASPMLHLSVTDGSLRHATKGNIRGHRASAFATAFAVTAIPTDRTPPVDIAENDSDGPRQLRFDDTGAPVVISLNVDGALHKPDFALVEGARTTLKGSLANFTGTSSSAAYAAGLFALALSCPTRPDIVRLRAAVHDAGRMLGPGDRDEIGAGMLTAPDFIHEACDPKPAAPAPGAMPSAAQANAEAKPGG